jgi:hypothetical protein
MSDSGGPLACPKCAAKYSLDERFCPDCGMPLVYAGRGEQEPITDAHGRARKIKPQYTGGELIRVAGGRNQSDAELIQNILLEEGIPSILRRTRGFDVPDFLAAGPRDVLVSEAAAQTARDMLVQAQLVDDEQPLPPGIPGVGSPLRLLIWILVAVAAAALIVWLLYLATT